ncbi:unnamed protein product [Paramecium octaurelia]|uniref:Uncharacterized protein n=1 Tax=Paramecium octaurelia TaxID=43137 RepID=A0A8S1VXJ5_PAROT|nr:unnamed protein product [Paramecium octaurelia]
MQYTAPIEKRLVFQSSQQIMPLMHRKENIFSPLRISPSTQQHFSPSQHQFSKGNEYQHIRQNTNDPEKEKEIKILIQHNQKMKDQINQQSIDYENLKHSYDKMYQDQLRLINELEQISKLSEQQLKEIKIKQEVIKDLQHQLETQCHSQNKNQDETQLLRQQLQIKDQEIFKFKAILEEKNLENQEIRNTLNTINQKVQFMTQQKDQQYQIIDKFNKELQDEITHKTQQIHATSQSLSQSQQQVTQLKFEVESLKNKLHSQQQLMPLQQLQQKFLMICMENDRLHSIIQKEFELKKYMEQQQITYEQEIAQLKNELKQISEEFSHVQQGLIYEQKNMYLIENLKNQLNYYIDENARLNVIIRQQSRT